jgi:hypothetical protein
MAKKLSAPKSAPVPTTTLDFNPSQEVSPSTPAVSTVPVISSPESQLENVEDDEEDGFFIGFYSDGTVFHPKVPNDLEFS